MHHGLLGGYGQGHAIPISRAVSRLRGTCMHHGLLGGSEARRWLMRSAFACPRWHAQQTRRSAELTTSSFFFCTVLELYC